MASSTGTMEHIMRVSGTTTRLRAKVLFGMLRGMCITESLKMIWQMAMESIPILMAQSTKESLETMCRRATEKKSG